MPSKVLVIGLDCAAPELVFDQFIEELPHIRSLIESGVHGPLKSTIPPITVPAWMSMVTGKDPGTLGFYGLRNRVDYSYNPMAIATAQLVKDKTLWDILSEAGKQVILVGIPQTYPPKPVNGCLIASFLTPDNSSRYTYPDALKAEIEQVADGYVLDVRNFRTENKRDLLRQIHTMTEKRFRVTRHLMTTRPWDFVMHVEMGTDRIHHGFWRFLDETHRKHEPGSEFKHAIRDYYRDLDSEIGTLIDLAGPDTPVLIVSDHGAKRIDGGICVNEWLIQEGYLKLKSRPQTPTPLEALEIDWSQTQAWGAGGYYARIFLNVEGREPRGTIPPESYHAIRQELAQKLADIPDPEGHPLKTEAFKPQEIYQTCNGVPPDLIVHFGDLHWRSVGTVGHNSIHTLENDTGPDDANHAQHGICILHDGLHREPRAREGLDIRDIAPTVLDLMALPIPQDIQGRSILTLSHNRPSTLASDRPHSTSDNVYSEEEQKALEDRLKALGYL